ncbi:MAG: Methylthioribulose-1-phosphate dehydratase [Chloroflexi bacterium ADurb.Bin325]|nr:MAG: Methylthioribulose-1-phosphate dehydratase [Chloroflexi bacterium ADurb.Bin325]
MSYGEYAGATPAADQGEQALRAEMIRIGQLMHQRNYVTATDGNLSVRLDAGRFLVTPSGLSKGYMRPEQLVVIDWDARPLPSENGSPPHLAPSSEILLHLEAYRQRPDIRAVVHAHPLHTIVLSMAGVSPMACPLPEVVVTLGVIATAEYATPASPEGATVIRDLIRQHDAIVLQRHGSVTVGGSLFDAYLKLEKLENGAEITYKLRTLGGSLPFPPGALDKLIDKREKMGLLRPGEREAIRRAVGQG